jgi:serine/threonine-protein phosphatase 2B catalytic subunit
MDLIRDVVDGKDAQGDGQLERLAEVISSPSSRTKPADGIA